MKLKPLKIGKLTLESPIFLAPMVDVTDLAYRKICRDSGASITYTEMINISAILHENQKTLNLLKKYPEEKPLGIQITGNNEEEFEKVLPYLKPYDLVDLNCGCPSVRITGNESGSFLLKNPDKIARMIKILKKSKKTVTAKIRLGYKTNNVIKIAKAIENAGADAITIHARLAFQGSSIPADWSQISKVKKAVKIPVIGNGDIDSGKKAEEMLKICDGVMIARAAIGNPLIFKQIRNYLETGKEILPDFKQNITLFQEYLKLIKKYRIIDIPRIKSLGCNFLKGQKGAKKLRGQLMKLKSLDEIEEFVGKIS